MTKESPGDLFLTPIFNFFTKSVLGAATLGSLLTFLAFGFLSVLVGNYQAYGIFALIGTLVMWAMVFLWASGLLASRFKFITERVTRVSATCLVAGNDDEAVDRNSITLRVMAEGHGLKVDFDKKIDTVEGGDFPPPPPQVKALIDSLNLKFRVVQVHGSVRKMRGFAVEAEEFLKDKGMGTIVGDAAREVMKRED